MKRHYINGILLLLAASVLFSACAYDAVNGAQDTSVPEDRTEESISEQATDSGDYGDTSELIQDATHENTEQTTASEQEPYDPSKEFDYLIYALKTYIRHMSFSFLLLENSYEDKFNMAAESGCALYVTLDPESAYYVCAYSGSDHENEFWNQCCLDDYTWVSFSNEQDIVEEYNGEDFVVCFRIYKTLSCVNILSENNDEMDMEYFQLYWTQFAQDTNTPADLTDSQSFIYFYSKGAGEYHQRYNPYVVYHSEDIYYHKNVTLMLTEMDGTDYVRVLLKTRLPDESIRENATLKNSFGTYYDNAMDKMATGLHSVTDQDGTVREYGLLSVASIALMIKMNAGD